MTFHFPICEGHLIRGEAREFLFFSFEDTSRPESNASIRHLGDALQDFGDTAALCELMDLAISVDTSVAHLSGALGRPTWVLLPFVPEWRWLLDRDDSPWFPSIRLYRQACDGDWDRVLGRVRDDLGQLGIRTTR
jgi:hypothetical protein